MKKFTVFLFLIFSFSSVYSQGDFVLEKRTGKYIYKEEFSKYDRKLIVDFVRNQTTGKWLIQKAEKWGLFSSKFGMVIQPEYDTIIILAGNSYGVLQDRKWAFYDSNGELSDFIFDNLVSNSNEGLYVRMNSEWGYYQNGSFTKNYIFISPPDESPTAIDPDNPDDLNNDKALLNVIIKYLKYPTISRENGITGKVWARVFITEKGDLDHVEIQTSVHESLDNEVLRFIDEHLYLWNPGKVSGQEVPSSHLMPFSFRLE